MVLQMVVTSATLQLMCVRHCALVLIFSNSFLMQVKLETLKLICKFVSARSSTKQAVARCHSTLLPAVAKSANEAAPDLREVRKPVHL